jgi:hypothetical protein
MSFTEDELTIQVVGSEAVDGYRYKSDTVTLRDADGNEGNEILSVHTTVQMADGPDPGQEDTVEVCAFTKDDRLAAAQEAQIVDDCCDKITIIHKKPPTEEPRCLSLAITDPYYADLGQNINVAELPAAEYTEADGYKNIALEVEAQVTDPSAITGYEYKSEFGRVKFDDGTGPQTTLVSTSDTVVMTGGPQQDEDETITVTAQKLGDNIEICSADFTIFYDEDRPPEIPPPDFPPGTPPPRETPPPPEEVPDEPPVIIIEPEPEVEEIVITPPVEIVEPELHEAAPVQPKTGPGMLIYLVGAGLGGAILSRRRRK